MGPAIAPDVLPRLFARFCSSKPARRRGLGLAIAQPHRRGARRQHRRRQPAPGRCALHVAPAVATGSRHEERTVLVVDDDDRMRETLGILLTSLGHDAVLGRDVADACRAIAERDFDLVISDLRMPGGSGLDVLDAVRAACGRSTPVILLTAYGTVDTAVLAMQRGAADYLLKPFDTGELEVRIARALAQRRAQIENDVSGATSRAGSGVEGLIGVSPALRSVLDLVRQVAPSDGLGADHAARPGPARSWSRAPSTSAARARDQSAGAGAPGRGSRSSCSRAELFGHTRGAFTGAVGRSRRASSSWRTDGTLFLDEIGEAPAALQAKLLRVLQDGVVERVGSNQPPQRRRARRSRRPTATSRPRSPPGEFRARPLLPAARRRDPRAAAARAPRGHPLPHGAFSAQVRHTRRAACRRSPSRRCGGSRSTRGRATSRARERHRARLVLCRGRYDRRRAARPSPTGAAERDEPAGLAARRGARPRSSAT